MIKVAPRLKLFFWTEQVLPIVVFELVGEKWLHIK